MGHSRKSSSSKSYSEKISYEAQKLEDEVKSGKSTPKVRTYIYAGTLMHHSIIFILYLMFLRQQIITTYVNKVSFIP